MIKTIAAWLLFVAAALCFITAAYLHSGVMVALIWAGISTGLAALILATTQDTRRRW